MLSGLSVSHIAELLPKEQLERLCDVCIFQGRKYMIMARKRTISIFKSLNTIQEQEISPDHFTLHQVLDCGFQTDSITAISWIKSSNTNCSQRAEFIVTFGSIIGIYAPQTLFTISHSFESIKVSQIIINNPLVALPRIDQVCWKNNLCSS